jgi:hypothetical protein
MKNIALILSIIIGISLIGWGANIIHSHYVHERNAVEMLKTGNEIVSKESEESHSIQAAKDLTVQLGLIIIGVTLVIYPIARKKHV